MSNQIKMNKQEITDSLSRAEMLEIARHKINSHFLTDYKTHEDIMADKQTGCAMIGFMKCWSWLGLDDTIDEKNAPQQNLSKYPKVPIELTEDVLHKNEIYDATAGWYCLPVINGLVMINSVLIKLAIRQESLTAAIKAANVHNTFDNKMTQTESYALIAQFQ